MDHQLLTLIFLAGIAGGLLAGLLGIGGGIIYIMILPIALKHVGVASSDLIEYTIANSVLTIFFATAVGMVMHWVRKEFYWKQISILSLTSIACSLLTLHYFVHQMNYSIQHFNVVILVLLLIILIKSFKPIAPQNTLPKKHQPLKLMAIGIIGGVVTAISGLGGGVVFVPLLLYFTALDIKMIKVISLGVIMFTSFAVSLYHMVQPVPELLTTSTIGYLVLPVTFPLVLGVMIGSPIGVRLSLKLKSHQMQWLFAIFVIFVVIKKIIDILTKNL